jgi:hypothetical protein
MTRVFYCFLCQKKHASAHEHKVGAKHFGSLVANFGSEPNLAERLVGKSEVHICCLWLKEGHEAMQRLEFRPSPPNKAHATLQRERRQSAPASLPPQQIDDVYEMKSPGETFLTLVINSNSHSSAHLPQRASAIARAAGVDVVAEAQESVQSTLAMVIRDRNELRDRVNLVMAENASLKRLAIVNESEKVRDIWRSSLSKCTTKVFNYVLFLTMPICMAFSRTPIARTSKRCVNFFDVLFTMNPQPNTGRSEHVLAQQVNVDPTSNLPLLRHQLHCMPRTAAFCDST